MRALRLGIHDFCKTFNPESHSPRDAVRESVDLAVLAERLGYERVWFSEHYDPRSGSASPEVLMAAVASRTARIHVGAGCVCIRLHSPVRVANAFLLLEALFPGRIELGLGRGGPVGERATRIASMPVSEDHQAFLDRARETVALLRGAAMGPDVAAVPEGPAPAVWLMGTGADTLQLAAQTGLGVAFHASYLPVATVDMPAHLDRYLDSFRASDRLPEPRLLVEANVVCAPTTEEARELAERWPVSAVNAYGTPSEVVEWLSLLADHYGTDELLISCNLGDPVAKRRSFELLAREAGLVPRDHTHAIMNPLAGSA